MLMRRTPLTPRSRPLRRLTPLRSASDRMMTSSAMNVRARDRVEMRDGSCVLCGGPGVDVHHRLPRGRGGARHERDIFALSRLVWLCRDDHLWVECHRLLAYGLGPLVRHGVTPCSGIPVFHHGRWVLLDDNGDVVPVEADSQGFEVAS